MSLAVRLGVPKLMIQFEGGPGDDLLCTAVLRELKRRKYGSVWMMSKYPEIFAGVGDADRVVSTGPEFKQFACAWQRWLPLEYAEYEPAKDRSTPPVRHIIAELCKRAGMKGRIELRPYFFLTEDERKSAAWAQGHIGIQSSGRAGRSPMQNKQWYPERFQEVIDRLKDNFKFVQLGSSGDPPLTGVVDLRGKTNIRETAAVLANACLFVGNVGFLMHLARAVECPSVILFGGREAPWQSGYTCNVNLYSEVPCAPCWQWNWCDFERKCMKQITVQNVLAAIVQQCGKPRHDLPVDTVEI